MWFIKIFFVCSSVYSYHLFLISSASVRSLLFIVPILSVLYCAHLFMKCSLGISNFLEDISSLSYSIFFLYFFALIAEEGFLISPFYSLELCIQMGISFLLSFAFSLLSQLFVRPHQTTILPFCISFFLGMVLIPASCTMLWTSIHSSSGTLSIRSNPLNLFMHHLIMCNYYCYLTS